MEQQEQGELDNFLKWAAELGISDSLQSQNLNSCLGRSLTVSHFPLAGGRGLGAARDLRRGELILRVPKSALLTTESAMKNDEILYLATKKHPSLNPTQVDYAVWAAKKAVTQAKIQWNEAKKLMEEHKLKPKLLTLKAWLWASGTISSRTLHVPWDAAGCLCPVGDLFNYAAPDEEANDFEDPDPSLKGGALDDMDESLRLTDGGFEENFDAYCFYAKRNYKTGEQVLLSYGTYSNLELLEHYGFLLHKNPNDKVFIPLEDSIYSSTSWPRDSLYIHDNGKPSFALLSALRLSATPANQRRSLGHLAYSGSQLSRNNEIHIMKWMIKNCIVALKKLPTSIEEDRELLSAIEKLLLEDQDDFIEWRKMVPAFRGEICGFFEAIGMENGKNGNKLVSTSRNRMVMERWKLAVQWRLRYKKVLVDCVSFCTQILNSLSEQCTS